MELGSIFNASLIFSAFRSATPIIYAALCAAITQQADILNIGTEGIMLMGPLTCRWVWRLAVDLRIGSRKNFVVPRLLWKSERERIRCR